MDGWLDFFPPRCDLLALENRGWCSHQTEMEQRSGPSGYGTRKLKKKKEEELTQGVKKTSNYEEEVIAEDGVWGLWGDAWLCYGGKGGKQWLLVSSQLGPSSEQSSSSAGGQKSICSAAALGSESTLYPRTLHPWRPVGSARPSGLH